VQSIFSKIIETKSVRLWSASKDRAEYERIRRVIGKDVKHVLDDEKISEALLSNSMGSVSVQGDLILIHDPSDIRKEYSSKLEDLGKVRNLNNQVINGYSSFNTIVIDVFGKNLRLLDTEIYSNRSPEYVTKDELRQQEKECPETASDEERQRYKEVKNLVAQENHINLSLITRNQLQEISDRLKEKQGVGKLTHVLDRGFDDESLFDFIDSELNDRFVIRLKISRVSEETEIYSDGKKQRIKLVNQSSPYTEVRHYQQIMIKNKLYQDVKCILEWGNKLGKYSIVKVQLIKRDGTTIFKQPMLLAANYEISNKEQAFDIYRIYLKRSKIEGVFKFLKEVLGWEEFQIRDFDSIKTLLTLCYFVAGYFYEIEDVLIQQDFIKFVAELGGGKGKVTRYYILQGFAALIIKSTTDALIEKHAITPEKLTEIIKWAKIGGSI
jgi:hypothetical protein